ncbi:MAG TPA: multiheme c-type cytochrome [Anaeromyxobacteraceae bacterium]|nr:multiheme c-type cytochrome [Anaeromyxobacteraceae bacterium]
MTAHRILTLLLAAPAIAAAAPTFPSVGPETCKACHPAAYEAWRTGPHARAFDSLPERNRKDSRCLACHAPLADDGFVAVGCETCHGAGGAYSARYVMRDAELSRAVGLLDPDEKTCGACHNDTTPSLTKFDYARKLPLIEHWSADRAARKAGSASRPGGSPAGATKKGAAGRAR